MNRLINNSVLATRLQHKITQEELARAVNVTRQTIIAIEKGNYTPSVLLALKLAKYFNTRVEALFILEE